MNYDIILIDQIRSSKYGNRAIMRPIHQVIIENGLEDRVAQAVIDTLSFTCLLYTSPSPRDS